MHPVIDLLRHNCNSDPEGLALVTARGRLTNAELYKEVRLLAAQIRELGVMPGDKVATVLFPDKNWPAILAVLHEGAVVMPLDSLKKPPQTKPALLIAERAIPGASGIKTLVRQDLDQLFSSKTEPELEPAEIFNLEQACWITHTSGTTGRPKGIEFSYAHALRENPYLIEDGITRRTLGFFGLPSNAGFSLAMRDLRSNQAYLGFGPDDQALAQVIEEFQVNELLGSPIQIAAFLDKLIRSDAEAPRGIEVVRPGGSRCPPKLLEQIDNVLGAQVRVSYATTEAGTLARRILKPGDDLSNVGRISSGVEVEVVSDSGEILTKGSRGHLRFKKPGMVSSYLDDPAANAKAFRDGWFYNGDIGMVTEDDEIILYGRADDVVNLGGEKVSLTAIDEYALAFDGVRDAARCLMRRSNGIPVIGLGFVADHDMQVDANKLLGELLTEFGLEAPRFALRMVRIPRNANGKVDRLKLAGLFVETINKGNKVN